MADLREIDEECTILGQELIDEESELEELRESGVQIAFLRSDLEKKTKTKVVYGKCEKVPDKYKWAVPFDFMITVFSPNIEKFSEKQLRILLFHELLHVGAEKDGNAWNYFVKPHDIEEFETIIDRYGMRWYTDGEDQA